MILFRAIHASPGDPTAAAATIADSLSLDGAVRAICLATMTPVKLAHTERFCDLGWTVVRLLSTPGERRTIGVVFQVSLDD